MDSKIEANLQHIKDCVIRINDMEKQQTEHSSIWQSCVNVLDYMMDLSPKNLRNVRLHTEIFSGEFFNFTLFNASSQAPYDYAEGLGYIYATESLAEKYWISEPPIFGWDCANNVFGCNYHGRIVNPEIARYQLYIENFVSTGMLEKIEKSPERSVVMEIGTGYGAIGFHLLKQTDRKVCYLVLDLPLMLLYTGCYIATHFPDAKVLTYDPANPAHKNLDDAIIDYDVVLIPNHQLSVLKNLTRIDYAINTISMAEMTPKQVQDYVDFIKPRLKNYFYFQNYAWTEPTALEDFVGKHFHASPALNTYSKYIADTGATVNHNYLRTYYFSVSTDIQRELNNCTVKLRMPDHKAAKVALGSGQITIRTSPNNYAANVVSILPKSAARIKTSLMRSVKNRIKKSLMG